MVKGLFINARTKQEFLNELNLGNIALTLIAFIKDTKEIWTLGVYYSVSGLTEDLVVSLINQYGGNMTLDLFKNLLKLVGADDFADSVKQSLAKADSALQSGDVFNWAKNGNADLIPEEKLQKLLVKGYYNEANDNFYSDATVLTASTVIPKSNNKLYVNYGDSKIYTLIGDNYVVLSGGSGDGEVDLSAYLTSAAAADTYITKTAANLLITDLIDLAPDNLNTLRELADAILNNKDLINTLPTADDVYTKEQADARFVTKTEFLDYKDSLATTITNITNRLTIIEQKLDQIWSDVPSETHNYYIGTDELTTSNYEPYLNLDALPATYTSEEWKLVYLVFPAEKTVVITDPASGGTIDTVTIGTVDGHKIIRTDGDGGIYGTINISIN